MNVKLGRLDKPSLVATRDGFGWGMVQLGRKNSNVMLLCADVTESTRCSMFRDKYPKRFVEMGVAEQNMANVASGLASVGKIPFMVSYAVFSPGRNWEPIRTTICYNNQPVKIVGCHAGLNVGPDGATHQALEDVALMRVLPNMSVVVPCDAIEARKATVAAAEFEGPVYLRVGREKSAVFTSDATPFEIGKAEVFREGSDVTVISNGAMVYPALLAARKAKDEDIDVSVINCHTVKPLDYRTIVSAAQSTGAIVTVEEHQVKGGLGSAVAELICDKYPVPVKRLGVNDCFGESGKVEELYEKHNLTVKGILSTIRAVLSLRSSGVCPQLHEYHPVSGQKLLEDVKPQLYFHAKSGQVVRSAQELERVVKVMNNEEFSHHVNESKNDFSRWINDVYNDSVLAHLLDLQKDKLYITRTLQKALRKARRQNDD